MRRKNRFLLLTCLIGFIVRVVFILAFAAYDEPRDWEYGDIARTIVAGNGYSRIAYPSETLEPTSSHAPFYPYLLAAAYSLFPRPWSFLIIQFVQTVVSVFIIVIAFRTARHLFGQPAANFTALGTALYPPLVYYSSSITPTVFTLFFLGLTVLLLMDVRYHTWRRSVCMGISYGCAVLCDPVTLVLIPAVVYWFLVSGKRFTRYSFAALIAALIVLLPWTLRNVRVHRTCIPITTQFGVNFWIGNNPHATGTDYYRVAEGQPEHATLMTHTLSRAEKQELRLMPEIERSRYYTRKALSFIAAKPFDFLGRTVKKAFYYWWFSPRSINGSPIALQYRILYGILYVPLLILALLSSLIFTLEHRPIHLKLIFALVVMISATYIFTHVGLIRYRIPVEFYLIVIAGSALDRLFRLMKP